jgi:hypothetical protein
VPGQHFAGPQDVKQVAVSALMLVLPSLYVWLFFLFSLVLGPKQEGSRFLEKVDTYLPVYMTFQKAARGYKISHYKSNFIVVV